MTSPRLEVHLVGRAGALQLDLELQVGEGPLVVVGPNGAGKTSLLLLLLGALRPTSGFLRIGERILYDSATGIDVPLEGRRLGYLPQGYALFPHLSVRDNLRFALHSSGLRTPDLDARLREALTDLELQPLADRRVTALSGGEKQRVALARALCVRPQALLLDEPLAAFDIAARRATREFLATYLQRLALPTLIVTHDAADAHALGHRLAVLDAGRVLQTGTLQQLQAQPATPFIREFLRL